MSKIKIFSLGGLNESGKNMYVVEVDNDVFIFDAGLKYADDKLYGIDYILPNYEFIDKNIERIKGIFISHGHDEHMGAIPDIIKDYPSIKVHASKFTLEILKEELKADKIKYEEDNLIELKAHKKVNFGDNSIFPVSVTHSVPEALGYALNTTDGTIFYSGNFMFDPTMIGSYNMDIGKLAYIGKKGVLCLLSESIYSEKPGFTSPKHRVDSAFSELINKNEGRILVNVMQADIYRIQKLLDALKNKDRKVVILGRRLEAIIKNAISKGYIDFDIKRISSISHTKDKGVVVLISDEREKPFSNMFRIVGGYDKFITLSDKDTICFASPVYDGVEKTAADLFDEISKVGSNLVILDAKKYLENHASSEDLLMMIDLMQPKYYFPVIGEYRHQLANANLASKIGIPNENILLKENGFVATFENGQLIDSFDKVKTEDLLIDGKTSDDIGALVLRDRESLGENGIVMVSTTISRKTKKVLAGPEVLTKGFIYVKDNQELIKEIEDITLEVVKEHTKGKYTDFSSIKNDVRNKLSKQLYRKTQCSPMILVVVQEI